MTLQKLMRMNIMLTGLGAALLLASSAYAQQSMNPTDFPSKTETVLAERSVPQHMSQNLERSSTLKIETLALAFMPGNQGVQDDGSDANRMVEIAATMLVIFIIGISAIVLYAVAATRAGRRRFQPLLRDSPYGPVSGATTH